MEELVGLGEELHVVTMYMHSEQRMQNYLRFVDHMLQFGVRLYTVEVAVRGQPFRTSYLPASYWHIYTDTPQIWHKERAINLVIEKIVPKSANYIAWIDADVIFTNPNWVDETIHALKRSNVVQLFSHTQDLDSTWKPIGKMYEGFAYRYLRGWMPRRGREISGLGWAARREVLDKLPLLDWMISSGADSTMAWAFVDKDWPSTKYTEAYRMKILEWRKKAQKVVNRQLGYVPGLALHCWHGLREIRGYREVELIMRNNKFDPGVDIVKNIDGLYKFTGVNQKLEADMNEWYKRREGR